MLEKIGLCKDFRKLVMKCIRSTSFSTLVEGSMTNVFHVMRGIQQEDSMSPLLFVVVLEFLSQRLIDAQTEKKIDVYKMEGEVECHLAFTDDVVLFCRASGKSFHAIMKFLQEFKEFVRLEINGAKNEVAWAQMAKSKNEGGLGISDYG